MRMLASGDLFDEEVIAEPFEMPGSTQQFAVHQALGFDEGSRGRFAASHVETGFAIAFGETPEAAIEAARKKWASKSIEERNAALERARGIRTARQKNREGGAL